MKINLNDFSLISNKWIDDKISQLEHRNSYDYYKGQLHLLQSLKQQLIESEKLAEVCFDRTCDIVKDNTGIRNVPYSRFDEQEYYFFDDVIEKQKENFLNSEIELP